MVFEPTRPRVARSSGLRHEPGLRDGKWCASVRRVAQRGWPGDRRRDGLRQQRLFLLGQPRGERAARFRRELTTPGTEEAGQRPLCRGSPVKASAYEGTARFRTTPGRVYPTNPAQQRESESREQRWMRPSPVELVFTAHCSSYTVATAPDTARVVDSSAFAAPLVGLAALRNPTLIPCFHSFRSGLEDNDP